MKKLILIIILFMVFFNNLSYASSLSVVVHVPEKYTDIQDGERF